MVSSDQSSSCTHSKSFWREVCSYFFSLCWNSISSEEVETHYGTSENIWFFTFIFAILLMIIQLATSKCTSEFFLFYLLQRCYFNHLIKTNFSKNYRWCTFISILRFAWRRFLSIKGTSETTQRFDFLLTHSRNFLFFASTNDASCLFYILVLLKINGWKLEMNVSIKTVKKSQQKNASKQ